MVKGTLGIYSDREIKRICNNFKHVGHILPNLPPLRRNAVFLFQFQRSRPGNMAGVMAGVYIQVKHILRLMATICGMAHPRSGSLDNPGKGALVRAKWVVRGCTPKPLTCIPDISGQQGLCEHNETKMKTRIKNQFFFLK